MKLQLSGGHYNDGKFLRFVDEVRDNGTYPTGYKMNCTSSSNHAHAAGLRILDLAERTSLSHAAAQHPHAFIKWMN